MTAFPSPQPLPPSSVARSQLKTKNNMPLRSVLVLNDFFALDVATTNDGDDVMYIHEFLSGWRFFSHYFYYYFPRGHNSKNKPSTKQNSSAAFCLPQCGRKMMMVYYGRFPINRVYGIILRRYIIMYGGSVVFLFYTYTVYFFSFSTYYYTFLRQ